MFYSTQILAKKGPLGTVWIASHLDRRLKRSQVFETNLPNTVGTDPLHVLCDFTTLGTQAPSILRNKKQKPAVMFEGISPHSPDTLLTFVPDNILNPEAPLALRLSGQLLLGVVKIYSRKVAFLFDDCNEALVKVTKVSSAAPVLRC